MAINFNGVRIKPASGGAGGGVSWPGDGTKLLAGDGSQVVVGDGLALSAGTLTTSSPFTVIQGDADARLLLHFEGANNSTAITDDTTSPLSTYTFAGSAAIKTAQAKFGSSSLYLDGVGTNYLRITNTNDKINFDGDFTIEGWFYFNSTPTWSSLFSLAKDGDYQGPVVALHNGQINFLANTIIGSPWEYWFATSGASITTGSWIHIAVVGKYLSSIKIYVNGVEKGSNAYNTKMAIKSGGYVYPGHYAYYAPAGPVTPNSFNGYIDEMRYSSVARYTSNFTPSASAFSSAVITHPSPSTGLIGLDGSGNNLVVCTDGATNTWKKVSLSSL
jgi:hypothetical protein